MELDLLLGLRSVICFGIVASTAALQPEIPFAAARPFVFFWHRLKLLRTSLAARFQSTGKERFWEIDMTKFEP